jgi:hypothetical protein
MKPLATLSPVQIACVTALVFATSIGALLLAWDFRRHNNRKTLT